jgi:hypothetical protein
LIAKKLMPVTGEEIEIENAAAEWPANLLLVCSWAEYREKAPLGPRFVGHVARFVLDPLVRSFTCGRRQRMIFPLGIGCIFVAQVPKFESNLWP